MPYLLTPSLHNSYKWYLKLDHADKASFLDTLNKKQIVQSEAMLDGIQFENDVRAVCEGKEIERKESWLECVKDIAETVKGGLWQQSCKLPVELCGQEFLLYGKIDVMKRDWLYDIKFTGNYDIGKFRDSVQHKLYMICTGIKKFKYLVTDGKRNYEEDYFGEQDTLKTLMGDMAEMVQFIMGDNEFKEAYERNWKTYPERKVA